MTTQSMTNSKIRMAAATNKILRLLEREVLLSASFILGRKKCRTTFTTTANMAANNKMEIVDVLIMIGLKMKIQEFII